MTAVGRRRHPAAHQRGDAFGHEGPRLEVGESLPSRLELPDRSPVEPLAHQEPPVFEFRERALERQIDLVEGRKAADEGRPRRRRSVPSAASSIARIRSAPASDCARLRSRATPREAGHHRLRVTEPVEADAAPPHRGSASRGRRAHRSRRGRRAAATARARESTNSWSPRARAMSAPAIAAWAIPANSAPTTSAARRAASACALAASQSPRPASGADAAAWAAASSHV